MAESKFKNPFAFKLHNLAVAVEVLGQKLKKERDMEALEKYVELDSQLREDISKMESTISEFQKKIRMVKKI